nr:MAG TPA: hypothetical protein [Caudoviricetes sp.]
MYLRYNFICLIDTLLYISKKKTAKKIKESTPNHF